MSEPITTNRTADFEHDGFVFCPGFAQASIEEIIRQLDRVILETVPQMPVEHVFYEDKSDPSTLKQLQLLHRHDSYFQQFAEAGAFHELACQLLNEEAVCQNVQYFNKPPKIGKPTPAHQDGYYFKLAPPNAVTMWLALETVDQENGCVRYVPGSHKQGMRPHGATNTLGFSQGITDFPNESDQHSEVAFPAQAGDLLAHHALTIHRADGNQSSSRTRRALGFIYYGVSAKVDEAAWRRYQADLKKKLLREEQI